MANRFLPFVVLAAAAGTLWSLRRQRRSDAGSQSGATPVQTWEGEGGALPATGAQLGPDPVVTASTGDARTADAFAAGDEDSLAGASGVTAGGVRTANVGTSGAGTPGLSRTEDPVRSTDPASSRH